MRSRLRWWIAYQLDRLPGQCWAGLVDWAMRDPGAGFRAALPWSPIRQGCYDDARAAGRCYCGSIGSDGTRLRRGETVCPTPMPGRPTDCMCSRPGGHEGLHRCGGVEWGDA